MCGATQAIQEKLAVLRADAPPSKDALAQVSRLALVARTGGERVAGIVTALRQFYGAGPRARAPVDLEQGLRLTLLLLEPAIRDAGVAVEVDFPGPLTVEGNAGELNQVFMNLLTNAFQAAPGGTVRVSGERRDGEVSVAVRDTGPGVPDEIRSRIFEPFFTTREPGQGTGLGLAICDSIVRAHGGRILVESPPGQGATFRLVLPALGAGGKVP
jgi:signal transduction histidine kinase